MIGLEFEKLYLPVRRAFLQVNTVPQDIHQVIGDLSYLHCNSNPFQDRFICWELLFDPEQPSSWTPGYKGITYSLDRLVNRDKTKKPWHSRMKERLNQELYPIVLAIHWNSISQDSCSFLSVDLVTQPWAVSYVPVDKIITRMKDQKRNLVKTKGKTLER